MAFVTTAFNAYGKIQQSKYAQGQANLQAQQSDYQAGIEQKAGLQTAQIIRRAGTRQVGAANAAYAGAGVKVGEGSALETERQIGLDSEHDAFQAILQGDRRAAGLRTDASLSRINGNALQTAGYVNAAGTLLSGGYQGLKASGWRTAGQPGFGGTQAPAPVETRYVPRG